MSVVKAVKADLKRIAAVAPEVAASAEAASALSLAAELDAGNSATSKSMCARALADLMRDLRGLTPEEEKGDSVDDLESRRAARLARRAVS